MIIRKRIRICDKGITIRCKNRKVLKSIKKFSKEFNIDLFLQDIWRDEIINGFCIINLTEVVKND